ncbi:MAG: ABC transporter permease, partial [Mesorhizobium sp.]
FRTSDQGLGATLALMLVALGSILVGLAFALFGAGTLAMGRSRA